jgi:hypothetical protein
MTTTEQCVHCDHLTATIEAAHERALVALTSPDAGRFDAVVWLSAHLAAVDRVVAPLIDRHIGRDAAARRQDRRVTRELQQLLRTLEQLAAADALAPRNGAAGVRERLVTLLSEHAASEHLLVEHLARVLGETQTAEVAARYEHAVAHGPTRPHPHQPHIRPLGSLMFVVDRLRDHVMDVLDSRHVPIPTPRRAPAPAGKWGHYLLGGQPPRD